MKVQIKHSQRERETEKGMTGISMFLTFAGIVGETDEPKTRQRREGWTGGWMERKSLHCVSAPGSHRNVS